MKTARDDDQTVSVKKGSVVVKIYPREKDSRAYFAGGCRSPGRCLYTITPRSIS